MSKEQKSAESNIDEQANESSGSFFQNEDNTKCAQLDLSSDTTLQDLPIELLELILIKAVAMEVKGLKLAKLARKEKADQITSRLGSVCSLWSNILATDHFQAELHRTIDDTAQDTIRLEVLQELSVEAGIHALAALKDEIFMLHGICFQDYIINVYDRGNLEKAKYVIPLPTSYVVCMTACSASNCLYVGLGSRTQSLYCTPLSVLRIWKDAEHKFNKSPWKHERGRAVGMFSGSANGSLLTFSMRDERNPGIVTVHDANDSLQLEVLLPRYVGSLYVDLLQRSNGNLVVSYVNYQVFRTNLLEIATTGSIVREYESSLTCRSKCHLNFADVHGRILITETQGHRRMELLDCEFNLIGVYSLQQDVGRSMLVFDLKYDSERSVIMRSHYDCHSKKNVLTTFRFTEE